MSDFETIINTRRSIREYQDKDVEITTNVGGYGIKVVIDTVKNKNTCNYFVPAAVSIAVFFTYLLLPNVQTFEILFYSYMYIGFYYNSSVRKIYLSRGKINEEKNDLCDECRVELD